ncbi:MAG: IS4 family transposase, partial [Crocosphaera sp.]
WCDRLQVSQQALSTRFLIFPAELFERVLKEILPLLKEKWHQRNHRPLPESVQFTLTRFEKIWIADGSTLEALFKKLKSLENVPKGQLAGKIGVVIDLVTRLPVEIWFKENPKTNDTKFEEDLLKIVGASTLLLLDRGFYHFKFWLELIDREIHFISRIKKGAAVKVLEVFTEGYSLRDSKIRLGSGTKRTPYITLRLIEIKSGKVWHSYLTSVLEPEILPPYVVADLYGKRWRIEEAFNTVKRLLGLSYLWVGSINGVKLQIWGTWLFYAILIDLGDAVADELSLPFDRISLEMIYRGLYHFGVANNKGETTDPVKYFAAPENKDLGIVKQKRKNNTKLIIAPFPEKQRNTPEFFFSTKFLTYA